MSTQVRFRLGESFWELSKLQISRILNLARSLGGLKFRLMTPLVLPLVLLVQANSAMADTAAAKPAPNPAPGQEKQPNIIILFADDLGYGDIQSFGHPYNRTPNIDRLAAEGQRWTDFYVAAPVCSPSRGALLTGKLPVRTGLYGDRIGVYFPNDPGGFPSHEITLAESLKAVGYRTGMFGKWHLGDAKHAWPTRHGFDEWLGLPYSNDMDWTQEMGIDEIIALSAQGKGAEVQAQLAGRSEKYADPKQAYWNVPLYRSKVTQGKDGEASFSDEVVERPAQQISLTRRYTEAAIEFMQAERSTPFFVYLPYTMPHTPLFRSEQFAGKSLGGRYGDVIEEIDWSVGQIRLALEQLDIVDNTLVVFSSDNGPWLTMQTEGGRAGLLRHGKGTTFEGGMRVPTFFSMPGKLAPGVVSEIGSTLDLFRTVAQLSGASAQSATDSRDLSPTLMSARPSPRQEMPYYRGSQLYAYRYGPWKLHLITEGAYRQPPEKSNHAEPLLYHLQRDPSERFDVAAEHPQIVKKIQKLIQQHRLGVEIVESEFDKRVFTATATKN